MVTLILNADDFGYSRGTNYAIIDTFEKRIVTSTTMMMNMPGTSHAVQLAKKHSGLGVGIHLVLTCGKPLCHPSEVQSIVKEDGTFYKNPSELLEKNIRLQEVEKEWRKQIDTFYAYGLVPTHLDSHHHVHTYPPVYNVIKKLSLEYGLAVRTFKDMGEIKPFSDVFCRDFYGEDISHELLNTIATEFAHVETVEIMVHPAYVDAELLKGSSYLLERVKETELLLTWEAPDDVRLYGLNE